MDGMDNMKCPTCHEGDLILEEECLHIHSRWVYEDGSVQSWDDVDPRDEPEGEPTGKRWLRCVECEARFDPSGFSFINDVEHVLLPIEKRG